MIFKITKKWLKLEADFFNVILTLHLIKNQIQVSFLVLYNNKYNNIE